MYIAQPFSPALNYETPKELTFRFDAICGLILQSLRNYEGQVRLLLHLTGECQGYWLKYELMILFAFVHLKENELPDPLSILVELLGLGGHQILASLSVSRNKLGNRLINFALQNLVTLLVIGKPNQFFYAVLAHPSNIWCPFEPQ